MKWLCVQNGAREHYAVARALHQTGRLERLFTEVWAGQGLRAASRIIPFSGLRSMAGRWHQELDGRREAKVGSRKSEVRGRKAEIVSWNVASVMRQFALLLKLEIINRKSEMNDPYDGFIQEGRWFSEKVRDYLARCDTDLRNTVVFSYDTTALELFRWAKQRNAICVLNQMDPSRVEMDLVRAEEKRWPGWALRPITVPEEYFQRREEEWKLADRIIVNSRWSSEALIKQGVPAEKLAVVPLCYEVGSRKEGGGSQNAEGRGRKLSTFNFQPSTEKPLRVLFLGQVVLRKGIQYLIESARLLRNEPVHFDVVGPIGISDDALKSAPANMMFHGRINRDEAAGWYERSDVFALPTLSDGFALTQIEAMAHGLPVIATPHCGEVVSDGVDGFLVPARDAVALAKAVQRFLDGSELLKRQQIAAFEKSRQFTLERLAERLALLEQGL